MHLIALARLAVEDITWISSVVPNAYVLSYIEVGLKRVGWAFAHLVITGCAGTKETDQA